MITLKKGDLLDTNSQTLVNTVNCVGVMGKGIALDFKRRYPEMYRDYVQRSNNRELKPGSPYVYGEPGSQLILNFPTKNHWRSPSKAEYIEKGLEILLTRYREWGIESIAIPPLGCGNGGLDWLDIGPIIFRYTSRMEIPVELYVPPHAAADDAEFQRISASERTEQQTQLPLDLAELITTGSRRSA